MESKLPGKLVLLAILLMFAGAGCVDLDGLEDDDGAELIDDDMNVDENDGDDNDDNDPSQNDNDPSGDDNDPSQNDNDDNDPSGDDKAYDGESCSEDSDCHSGQCLTGDDWPGGHCTTVDCQEASDCEQGGGHDVACLQNPQGSNFCARLCDSSAGCRDDYQCYGFSNDDGGWCGPDYDGGGGGGGGGGGADPTDVDLEGDCQNTSNDWVQFNYDVSSTADSYMIVPYSTDSESVVPTEISLPSNGTIDFQSGTNQFQLSGAQLLGVINPLVIPATDALSYQFETGSHTLSVYSEGSEVCYYYVENSSGSTTIDVNFYFVGHPTIDASNAATNNNFQAVLNEFESIFQQQGISVGETRYFDVPQEAEDNYSIVRSRQDASAVTSYSEEPGSGTDNELMSANIFITEQFSFSGGGGVLGISLGIPGAAGMHGAGFSGVVMTGEYIGQQMWGSGNGNTFTGVIMAHELGHFLGLFHTTEQSGQAIDPIQDTPTCTDTSNYPQSCDDWGNLMFPAADSNNTELTNGQGHVLEVNPLTK